MTTSDLLRLLESDERSFQRQAVQEAISRREEIIPHLLDILERDSKYIDDILDRPFYMGHIYSMFILSQFREKRAYPIIAEFFSHPGEISLDVTGDLVTERLDSILASVSCGDIGLIKDLIENPEVNEYVREAAVCSLLALVKAGELSRDSVIAYYKALFQGKLEREPSVVWGSLAYCCADLYPEEVYKDIENCYRTELIDPFMIGLDDVKEELEAGKAEVLRRFQESPRYHLIDDTISEMEWWHCFKPDAKDDQIAKVGRNSPCPCGSGKKYKKCCINAH